MLYKNIVDYKRFCNMVKNIVKNIVQRLLQQVF